MMFSVIRNTLVIAFIIWVLYVALPYRLTHPELTETQLTFKMWSFGMYDPLKED